MKRKQKLSGIDKRKYIRLNSIFPVEFQVLDSENKTAITKSKQGFTNNVSKGGICLSVNNVEEDFSRELSKENTLLALSINIPLNKKPVKATAKIAWVKKIEDSPINQHLIGLNYTDIDKKSLARIVGHARWMRFTDQRAVYFIVFLMIFISAIALHNFNLRIQNEKLINKFVSIAREGSSLKNQLRIIQNEKRAVETVIAESKKEVSSLELRLSEARSKLNKALESKKGKEKTIEANITMIKHLEESMAKLTLRQKQLEDDLSGVSEKEGFISEELDRMQEDKAILEEAVIDKMYHWLSVHRNPRTGLTLSFEGDAALRQWAFTYDQALVAQVYTIFKDPKKAQGVFSFFRDILKREDKFEGFYNAYYADSGDVSEYVVHCGPNIWLGIAVLQYAKATNDLGYLPVAIKIADWLISIQEQDREGGIRGGPDVRWFATEHNLDAFAFFSMLYKITKDTKYEIASKKVLNWLNIHAYDKPEPPVKRGKGDATIATDTYAWSIAAVGPERLKRLGMNPDEILEFAIENCEVTVNYQRPSGRNVEVTGFDFAKYRNLPRGGIISSEWTAQMVVSFKIMSRFYNKQKNYSKAKEYQEKAEKYLNELNKLIISSPSPTGQGGGCLPYSTAENSDTGHGWRTPFGNRTGSIAGTAYTLFAHRGYNPLEI